VIARRALTTPAVLAAIALLIVNDHILKGSGMMPGVVTGKLSDLAGMVFFPLLLAAGLELARVRVSVGACAIATGVVFAAIKLIGPAGDAYRFGLGALQWPLRALGAIVGGHAVPGIAPVHLTADPTDLLVLPALLIPVWIATSRRLDVDRAILTGTGA
jgi:hypothetical protein